MVQQSNTNRTSFKSDQVPTESSGSSQLFVLPLYELARGDLAVAGGKGANLGELIRAGLRPLRGAQLSERDHHPAPSR